MGTDELLYLRFGNTMLEPVWNRNHIACMQITMAEDFGVEDRGHFYDPVGALRDVVVNHLMQVVAVAAMEAPAGSDAKTLKDAKYALFRAIENADPRRYVRGQYDGYRTIDGVAADSTTETYAALRLQVDNWRWSGVPWFIRTGKRLPITQTELRAVFRKPPRLMFMDQWERRPEANQLVDQARSVHRRAADPRGAPRRQGRVRTRSRSTWSSHRRAARRRRPTRCCCWTCCAATAALHPPGRRRRDVADIPAAARRARGRCTRMRPVAGARRRPRSCSAATRTLARPVGSELVDGQ